MSDPTPAPPARAAREGTGGARSAGPPVRDYIAFVRERPSFLVGHIIVACVLGLGLLAPWLPLHSPVDADPGAFLQPPSLSHPMGTDSAGLDVFSRVLHAPRTDLSIAIVSTLWAALAGASLGAFVGLWEGRRGLRGLVAATISRSADVLQAFPVFALALVLVAVLGQGVTSIILAIGAVNIPIYLRLMRGETLMLRSVGYVEAAQMAGGGDLYILTRHVAPNALAPLLAQMSVGAASAVLIAAGLSFLGAGIRAPTPEWGSMIAMGFQNVITGQWWPSIFPGLALALTVFGLGRVGAAILAFSNPRERARPTRRAWRAFLAARAPATGPERG